MGDPFDAGAFSSCSRSPRLLGILDEALHGTVEVVLPRTVIARVWRGSLAPGQHRDAPVRAVGGT